MSIKRKPRAGAQHQPGQHDLFFSNDNPPRRRAAARSAAPVPLEPTRIRSKVSPRDVPATKAARLLHLTLDDFLLKLPELLARGFPAADPTTRMFDLKAIEAWQDARNPHVLALTDGEQPKDAREVVNARLSRL